MDELKERLRDIERLDPPELWHAIEGRSPGSKTREPRRWPSAVIAILVASLAIAVAVVALPRGTIPSSPRSPSAVMSNGTTPTIPASPREQLAVSATLRLTTGGLSVAWDNGSVWVASAGKVLRVDPTKMVVTGSLTVPHLGELGSMAAVDGGPIWVVPGGSRHEVFKIDTSTDSVIGSIRLPGYPAQIVADRTSVWVISATNGTSQLIRIDPVTDVVTLHKSLPASPNLGFTVGDGSAWIGVNGSLIKVAPDGTEERFPGLGGSPLSFGAGSVWEGTGAGVTRIDPSSGKVLAQIPSGQPIGLSFADGLLWVLTDTGSKSSTIYIPDPKHPSTVMSIDPATNGVSGSPVDVGFKPMWMAAGGGACWVMQFNVRALERVTATRRG